MGDWTSIPGQTKYEARVQHAFEVATVLKKNIVQGKREDGDTYRLRITPDTELGSNEGVKAPYSRPTRGAPRLKCGEDPNAVTPLPPKSLRGSYDASASSSRPYSTQVQTTNEPEILYDKHRVQSLVAKLSQVNRRVSASPTGKGQEQTTDPVLLEDKLTALATWIDNLSHTHTPPEGQQTAIDAFLDVIFLNSEDVGTMSTRSDPPVQIRQFVRYLHGAARAATDASGAAIGLSPALRTAIGEEMETPSPKKDSGANTPLDELRAVVWRMLMVKRGMQRVAAGGNGSGPDMSALQSAVQRTLRHLTSAQRCLEDLEKNGPRTEDAMALLEEMEKVMDRSVMLEMMNMVQRRLEQGTLWKLVDEERKRCRMVTVGENGDKKSGKFTSVHFCSAIDLVAADVPGIQQPHQSLREFEEQLATPPPIGTGDHISWRRQQLFRSRCIIRAIRQRMHRITTILDELIVISSQNHMQQHKASTFHTAKQTFTPRISHQLKEAALALRKLAKQGSALEWAHALNGVWSEAKVLESQLRQGDTMLRNFIRNQQAEEFRANKEGQKRFMDLKMEMVLAFDLAWRMGRRLKHDRGEMYKIASAAASKGDKPRRRPAGKQAAPNLLQLPMTRGDTSKGDRTKRLDTSSNPDRRTLPKEGRRKP
ncbi:hypothetical protein FRC12_021066 [Ceratobasidium sp. 428]|nr:hypothetical protein FRC12_021066 [Ceratobasidium sp. 428]